MCSDRHQGLRKIVGEKYFKPFGDSTFIFALVFMHKSQKDRFHVKIWQYFNNNVFVAFWWFYLYFCLSFYA